MNQIIEVKLVKKQVNYIATASLFPSCKGIGKTKKDALNHLSKSISSFISKHIEGTLTQLFSSHNYTQIVMDHSSSKNAQTIAFHLNQIQPSSQKTFLFKVPSLEKSDEFLAGINHHLDGSNLNHAIMNKRETMDENDIQNDIFEWLGHDKAVQDSDEIIFGFPLNFN